MARINRSDIIQKAINDLALSSSSDTIPNETLDKVQLTYNLNRKYSSFVLGLAGATSGTQTSALPSVSAGSDIYITAVTLSLVKDSTCDIAIARVNLTCIPDSSNVSANIIGISVLTTTAQSDHITLNLSYPLKLKNGSSITMTGTYAAGLMSRFASVIGFTTSSN